MSEIRSIGILGAGVCGLAAAYRLLQTSPDLHITLLESESHAGGLARSLSFKGLRADLGPHRIHTELAGILDFIKGLAGEEIVEVRRSSRMWLEGRWVDYPPRPLQMLGLLGPLRLAGYTLSYAASHLLPRRAAPAGAESFQTLMERAFGPKLYRFLVEPYTSKVWKTPPGELHGDVARVRVSAGGLGKLIKQALGGGEQPQDAAALKSYHYLKGGIGRLADRLVEEIEQRGGRVELNRTVAGLEWRGGTAGTDHLDGGGEEAAEGVSPCPSVSVRVRPCSQANAGWRVVHVNTPPSGPTAQSAQQRRVAGLPVPAEDKQVSDFDFVLSTLPVTDLVTMLTAEPTGGSAASGALQHHTDAHGRTRTHTDAAPAARAGSPDPAAQAASSDPAAVARDIVARLRFLANILVFVELDRPLDTPNQWLYFPHRDLIFNRGYVPANFDPGLGRPDRALLCLEVTCFPGDATWDLEDAQVAARVREDIAATGLVDREAIRATHIFRIPYTYPFYDLDYRDNTDRVWEFLRCVPRLLSAGRQGLFLHNNIDHSVFMGLHAADALLANPDLPGPAWYARIREYQGFRIVD